MSTYTTKSKIPETKQQFIEESSKHRKQTLLTIILIFFLILLLLFSVLISNKFTITSMDVRKSAKQLDFAYYEVGNGETSTTVTTEPTVTESPKQTEVQQNLSTKTEQIAAIPEKEATPTPKITPSEKKIGIDGKIITSKNIKSYHSLLLKEFEGIEIASYKIIWGDTLWKIAMKFNTSAHTLYVLNALDNPDLIIAGNKLKIVKNFILPKEKTEKILENALKNKTSYNNNNFSNYLNMLVYLSKSNENQLIYRDFCYFNI